MHNAPSSRINPLEKLLSESGTIKASLAAISGQLNHIDNKFDGHSQRILSQIEDGYTNLMQTLNDEAREGPRLFSFQPVDPGFFERPNWISQKFQLTLWCEHSRLPLPELNRQTGNKSSTVGIYELTLPRDWLKQSAPLLKIVTSTLSLILPAAASATQMVIDETAYKDIEKELDLGQKSLDLVLKGTEKSTVWLEQEDAPDLEKNGAIRAQGAVLRQIQSILKDKDPSFGGLVRVRNKREEFLWVHPQFEGEY